MSVIKFGFLYMFLATAGGAHAGAAMRVSIPASSLKEAIPVELDAFFYFPDSPRQTKGIIVVIGGSGYSIAGYGGPAKLAAMAIEHGFMAVEWNKRGIRTNYWLNETTQDQSHYQFATLDGLIADAASVLHYVRGAYPHLPIFIAGGSEGSMLATRLAELYPEFIRAIATFGTVVPRSDDLIKYQTNVKNEHFWRHLFLALDKNADTVLSREEFAKEFVSKFLDAYKNLLDSAGKKTLESFFGIFRSETFENIDLNSDGVLSRAEVVDVFVRYWFYEQHDNPLHLVQSEFPAAYLSSTHRFPSLVERIDDVRIPYLILQGEHDHDTPAHHVRILESQCKARRGCSNVVFRFFNAPHRPTPEIMNIVIQFFDSNLRNDEMTCRNKAAT